MARKSIDIYIDGAAEGNPGPAGVGIVFSEQDQQVHCFTHFLGETTNNTAEYLALIYGLQEALILKYDDIQVFSDSQLLVNQMNGSYKVKHDLLRIFCGVATHLKNAFHSFRISHIPREKNKAADALAKGIIKESKSGDRSASQRHFPF